MNHSGNPAPAPRPGPRPKTIAIARLFLSAILTSAGCSSDDEPETFTLALSAGLDADALAQPPAPSRLSLIGQLGASPSTLLQGSWPASSLEVGALPSAGDWVLRAELRDEAQNLLGLGFTTPLPSDQLLGGRVPIHCGRVGAFSRPSTGIATRRDRPSLGLAYGRYLFVTSNPPGETPSELYDLLSLAPLVSATPLPRSPRSVAVSQNGLALLLDDAGASLYDLDTGASTELAPGLADASGGATVSDLAGGAFIVGATRSTTPTSAVVRIDASGAVSLLSLARPRRLAAATWVAGTGLVIAGGDDEASVEILAPGASSPVATGLQIPATSGGSLAPLGDGNLLLAGGLDPAGTPRPPLRFALSCSAGCPAPQNLETGIEAASGRGYAVGASKTLLVGDGKDGTTATLVDASVDPPVVSPVALRQPRSGASSVQLPDGRVLVVGGADGAGVLTVEIFTPFQ